VHVDSDARSLHKTETQRRDAATSSTEDGDSSDDVDEKEDGAEKKDDDATHGNEKTYEEIRGGIPYEHDTEAPSLEKKKSTKSVKDPNLVS
jgi:hypothetical protein